MLVLVLVLILGTSILYIQVCFGTGSINSIAFQIHFGIGFNRVGVGIGIGI